MRARAYGEAGADRRGRRPARVVVGVSGSLASLAALRVAAQEARRGGATLVAVTAWSPPEGERAYLRRPDRDWLRHWQGEARARLDLAFDEVFGGTPTGVPSVERRVVRDRPGPALCAVACGPDDRVVVGAARAGRVRRYVLAHARVPVLTVPAPAVPRRVRRALRRATVADIVAGP
ncbi:universal stress protein [Streptomyces sp. NPDC048172]|uniref:universal stress protein n=1 Tax=Streptomyces sp. NPDC048172 TaxID=3365505 RepID=UPI00371BC146